MAKMAKAWHGVSVLASAAASGGTVYNIESENINIINGENNSGSSKRKRISGGNIKA